WSHGGRACRHPGRKRSEGPLARRPARRRDGRSDTNRATRTAPPGPFGRVRCRGGRYFAVWGRARRESCAEPAGSDSHSGMANWPLVDCTQANPTSWLPIAPHSHRGAALSGPGRTFVYVRAVSELTRTV